MTLLPNDRLKIDTIRNTPEGPVTKVTIVDGSQGWVLEQHVYDVRRRLVASSIASGHRRDPLTGLVMPTVVQIDSPQAQLSMRIDLGNVEINRLTDDRPALWTMPNIPGTPLVEHGRSELPFPRAARHNRHPPPHPARQPPAATR